ncbi:hypothetical protein [Faecalibaculum rodentium]|uniref:Replication protein n=4 Tax=Faecalibaculum rodentium TaxID=1702221 RepID=A0A140DTG3_9FIRM|nr:hypothetical protein [Faecalibaculum rodentium]AMK53940.1 hypothetical protein AALO17_08060 [Faecalibaculum rodentium]
MNAKDVISYIHADMDKKYRLQDTTECHAAILKDWMRNDAFLPDQDVDVLRLKYDDAYMGDYEHGFHDLCFRQDMFIRYIEQAANGEEDVYFSINSFWNTKRTEANIRHLNAFVIDYDYYKIAEYADLSAAEMYQQHIRPSLVIDPTFVIDSGRGLYCIFCIDHAPYACTGLYKAIYSKLVESQERFGADPKAMLTTQVIRVPGSINSRSGRTVAVLEAKDQRYTLSELAHQFLPYTRQQVRDYKREKAKAAFGQAKKAAAGKRKANRYQSELAELESDLIALISMRNDVGITVGYREVLLYLYWERAAKTKMEEESITKKILWLNSLFTMPLTEKEALSRCRPAQNYRFLTAREKMVRKLGVTDEEQGKLKFLVNRTLRDSLRQAKSRKKARIKHKGRTAAQEARYNRRCALLKGLDQGLDLQALSQSLGVTKKTLRNDCKYILSHHAEFAAVIKAIKQTLRYTIKTLRTEETHSDYTDKEYPKCQQFDYFIRR